ncbi:MAG: helix-turn-helix domain-containing protein [Rhodospirillales bacterium]|jgi:DNA-binding HxlR family transcriptional regulator|nr:helix-turn-helix domain-containing protein [Rhodospirillales bacterium]HJO73416.1 helix-turn-helix domain-containing protein [Rhodospirillales bacterium]
MREASQSTHCSVARTLEIVSDPWTFLLLREAYFGVRRFDRFKSNLGIPGSTLASRLQRLVKDGLFKQVRYQDSPTRHEYKLTEKGRDLYPSMLILMKWGDRWLAGPKGPPLSILHKACGQPSSALVTCSHCNREIDIKDVTYRDGPGAGRGEGTARRRLRRSSNPDNFLRGREDSVARTLKIIGNKWTFLILREAFFGVRRFDEVRRNLGISTNILSDRLQMLVGYGIFQRRQYSTRPKRFEYVLSERGRDLYSVMIAFLKWGDKWLAVTAGPPLVLHHTPCGHDFVPVLACSVCGSAVDNFDINYMLGPGAAPAEAADGSRPAAAAEAPTPPAA